MATELNLPFVRYVRQVSNGISRTKYSYLGMQQDLLVLLQKAQWKMATCTSNYISTVPNKVTQTDGEWDEDGTVVTTPSYTTYIDDRYDAYKQGGDANSEQATFCGYAGLVAYRFTLPTNYTSTISKIGLNFSTARYLRSGLRVSVVLNDNQSPSDDWDVIRGEAVSTTPLVCSPSEVSQADGVKSWGICSQDVPTLMDSRASEGTFEIKVADFPQIGTSTKYQYMWVYISIEDYTDYWTYYDAQTPRYYSIEGSATLIPSRCSVTFTSSEEVPTTSHTLDIVKNGVVPSVWDGDEGSQLHHVTVQRNGDPIPDGNLQMIVKDIENSGGTINKVDVLPPLGHADYDGVIHFACICGKGFEGTFKNIPGLLLYDCEKKRLVQYTGKNVKMDDQSRAYLQDEVYHYGIVKCLMNYQINKGFFMLPCIGRHVTESSVAEGVTKYDMLVDQVDGIYTGINGETFVFFNYDKDACAIKNIRAEETNNCAIKNTKRNNEGTLIGLPANVTCKHKSTVGLYDTIWLGMTSKNSNNTDTNILIHPILYHQTSVPEYYNDEAFLFTINRYGTMTGKVKELITVPYNTYCPNPLAPVHDYQSGVGVVVNNGEVYFQGMDVYNDINQITYTSTTHCTNSVKIVVLYKENEAQASHTWVLDSSLEKSGLALTSGSDVSHQSWSVRNNVVTSPSKNQWIVSGLTNAITVGEGEEQTIEYEKVSPIRVIDDFSKIVTGYDKSIYSLCEMADNSALFALPTTTGDVVRKGTYIVNRDVAQEYSSEGLRVCYGRFYNGQSVKVNGLQERIGASFSLNSTTQIGLQFHDDEYEPTKTINCWQIAQSSLVVPFGCPRTWKAKQVKLDWSNWTGTATPGSKLFVWLMRDNFVENHPDFLGQTQVSIGGTVNGAELIGEIDPTSTTKNKTFNINDLGCLKATIIITAWMDMDDINPTASMAFPRGIGKVGLNMKTMEVSNTTTGFIPDIQLLG